MADCSAIDHQTSALVMTNKLLRTNGLNTIAGLLGCKPQGWLLTNGNH